jgi:hypothetical protein
MVEVFLHSPISLRGRVLNFLGAGIISRILRCNIIALQTLNYIILYEKVRRD